MNPSKETSGNNFSRRSFSQKLMTAGSIALFAPELFARPSGSDTIRVGLIGCGGRGTGAGIIDCAESSPGIELTAIGDLFQDHLDTAPEQIKANLSKRGLPVNEIYKVCPDGPEW